MNLDRLKSYLKSKGPGIPSKVMPLRTERPSLTERGMRQLVDEVHALGGGKPCELYAWIMRREADYFDGPGRDWTHAEICYAACRDWNQWKKMA